MTRRSRDRGAGTVLVLAAVLLAAALASGAAVLGRAVLDRHRAAAAADLAALAAASDPTWPSCERARRVAAGNGARLLACAAGGDGAVTVEVTVASVAGARAVGRARAGPAPGTAPRPSPGQAPDLQPGSANGRG